MINNEINNANSHKFGLQIRSTDTIHTLKEKRDFHGNKVVSVPRLSKEDIATSTLTFIAFHRLNKFNETKFSFFHSITCKQWYNIRTR